MYPIITVSESNTFLLPKCYCDVAVVKAKLYMKSGRIQAQIISFIIILVTAKIINHQFDSQKAYCKIEIKLVCRQKMTCDSNVRKMLECTNISDF